METIPVGVPTVLTINTVYGVHDSVGLIGWQSAAGSDMLGSMDGSTFSSIGVSSANEAKTVSSSVKYIKTATASTTVSLKKASDTVLGLVSGTLQFSPDATYDIGASGSGRPKDIYCSGNVTAGGTVTATGVVTGSSLVAGASGTVSWTGRSKLQSAADGSITLLNNAGSDFTSLQFGGTSASFPMLKRAATAIQVKTASDSAFADLAASVLYATGGRININVAATMMIKTGSGSPETVLAADVGSLYLRTDGGATTTLYVKTSGTGNTGWTAK